ncbi:unnamed protein product [Closterium sp. Naga37s-1]|nr:unnamed protein product [Closterium sp. Naga37s-1]
MPSLPVVLSHPILPYPVTRPLPCRACDGGGVWGRGHVTAHPCPHFPLSCLIPYCRTPSPDPCRAEHATEEAFGAEGMSLPIHALTSRCLVSSHIAVPRHPTPAVQSMRRRRRLGPRACHCPSMPSLPVVLSHPILPYPVTRPLPCRACDGGGVWGRGHVTAHPCPHFPLSCLIPYCRTPSPDPCRAEHATEEAFGAEGMSLPIHALTSRCLVSSHIAVPRHPTPAVQSMRRRRRLGPRACHCPSMPSLPVVLSHPILPYPVTRPLPCRACDGGGVWGRGHVTAHPCPHFPLSCLIPYCRTPSPDPCRAEHATEEAFGAEGMSLPIHALTSRCLVSSHIAVPRHPTPAVQSMRRRRRLGPRACHCPSMPSLPVVLSHPILPYPVTRPLPCRACDGGGVWGRGHVTAHPCPHFPLSCLIPYCRTPSPDPCRAEHATEEAFGAEGMSLPIHALTSRCLVSSHIAVPRHPTPAVQSMRRRRRLGPRACHCPSMPSLPVVLSHPILPYPVTRPLPCRACDGGGVWGRGHVTAHPCPHFPLSCLIPYCRTPSPDPCRAEHAIEEVFGAEYVSLHVRKSNRAAFHLYTETLGYNSFVLAPSPRLLNLFTAPRPHFGRINDIEAKYYADSEDAYDMRKNLKPAAEKPKKEVKLGKAASDDKASSNNEDAAKDKAQGSTEDAGAAIKGDKRDVDRTARADESKAGEKKEEGSEKGGEKEVAAPATPAREKEKGASRGGGKGGSGRRRKGGKG